MSTIKVRNDLNGDLEVDVLGITIEAGATYDQWPKDMPLPHGVVDASERKPRKTTARPKTTAPPPEPEPDPVVDEVTDEPKDDDA